MAWSDRLLVNFGEASAALAAAAERLALFPARDVLRARIRLAEQEALAWLEGELLNPDQLALDYGSSPRAWRQWPFAFVRCFDRELAAKRPPDADSVAKWLSDTGALAAVAGPAPNPERLAAWQRRAASLAPTPRLIAGADLAATFARIAPLGAGDLVIGAMLGDRYCLDGSPLTAGGIAAIGLRQRTTPWLRLVSGGSESDLDTLSEAARDERCRVAWLEALAAGAAEVVALDKRLRIWLTNVEAACRGTRKSSHLRELALLAGLRPSITATRAAQELGISRQAATRLTATACERRILREITYGNAFRRYVIAT